MPRNDILLSITRNTAAVKALQSLLFKMSYAGERLARSAMRPMSPISPIEVYITVLHYGSLVAMQVRLTWHRKHLALKTLFSGA